MCGGFFHNYFEHYVLSLAVNTGILCGIMVKGTNKASLCIRKQTGQLRAGLGHVT